MSNENSNQNAWNPWCESEAMKVNAMEVAGSQPNMPLLYRGSEAARICGVCERTLSIAAGRGELKVVRIGRAVRYRLEDLQAWINSKLC